MIFLTHILDKIPSPFFANHCEGNVFFLLPPWYKYLNMEHDSFGSCVVAQGFEFPMDLLPIGIAVIEMLVRIAGFVSVIAVIASGIRYMTAQGNPEKAASARRGLYTAIAGMLIALVATALVGFIGGRIG